MVSFALPVAPKRRHGGRSARSPACSSAVARTSVARAHAVTVRRLADEVSWVLEARDASGASVSLDPPPLDAVPLSPLAHSLARETPPAPVVQIGARAQDHTAVTRNGTPCRPAFEVCDAEVRFTGPASVAALFRDALDTFAPPGEPRWSALERLLHHVIGYWEATPRHRDPIFASSRATAGAARFRRAARDATCRTTISTSDRAGAAPSARTA